MNVEGTTLHVSLTGDVKSFVEQQVATGPFQSPDAYVAAVLTEEHKRNLRREFEALVQAGIDSGPPIELTAEMWAEQRRRIVERFGAGSES